MDGCSTGETPTVVRCYPARLIELERPVGNAREGNRAAKVATGDAIAMPGG